MPQASLTLLYLINIMTSVRFKELQVINFLIFQHQFAQGQHLHIQQHLAIQYHFQIQQEHSNGVLQIQL